MNQQGEIYSAPADQIPSADVKRLETFINQAAAKLPNSNGKVPASTISALFKQIQDEKLEIKPEIGHQMKFKFADGTSF